VRQEARASGQVRRTEREEVKVQFVREWVITLSEKEAVELEAILFNIKHHPEHSMNPLSAEMQKLYDALPTH
jgi:hypothetical protein